MLEFMPFVMGLFQSPVLLAITLLVAGVIIVNGATDAPNAIATVVSTRSLSPRAAIMMAATCNFLGLMVITMISSAVASTVFNMVDFAGDTQAALIALLAAMVAIIVWGVAAWYFGIPSSQSHSLIAGLTGAAIALQGGFGGINGAEWMKVIYGILLSTFLGFGSGWCFTKLLEKIFANVKRQKTDGFFKWGQILGGAGVAFMHGAQDGQKFIGIFMLAILLANGQYGGVSISTMPLWLMLFCALCMGVGTAVGGQKIIKSVGMDMVKLDRYQGFSASVGTLVCLVISTFGGLPVSTTHTASTCIMGVGAARRKSAVKWGIAIDMVKTWVLTFPGCGLMGFIFAHVFLLFV